MSLMPFISSSIELNKSMLDSFSMQNQEYLVDQTYYELPSGEAEYRLYSYISSLFSGITILDIGTNQGRSAVSLSHNPANHVISYDIEDHLHSREYKLFSKSNMEFHIKNVLDDITPEFIAQKNVQLVMIDICHYGNVERRIMDALYTSGFRGLVLLDDIHHPDPSMREPMEKMWAELPWPKWDVSAVGHYSGTGLVSMQSSTLSVSL